MQQNLDHIDTFIRSVLGHLRGTKEIMCSRIVTLEELSEVKMLQMSMNTLHGSHAAQKLVI